MNFVDAAITLLREHGRPMHVEELCREAVERGLLSRPGSNPLRVMKGRLTTEAKKPDGGHVVRVEPDVWQLREENPAAKPAGPSPTEDLARLPEAGEASGGDGSEEAEANGGDGEGAEASGGDGSEEAEASGGDGEEELRALYGDEPAGTTPVADLTEYRDEHTEDEDRPLLPEIVARRGRQMAKKRRAGPGAKERQAEPGERAGGRVGEGPGRARERRRGRAGAAKGEDSAFAQGAEPRATREGLGDEMTGGRRSAEPAPAEDAGGAEPSAAGGAEKVPGGEDVSVAGAEPGSGGGAQVSDGIRLRPGSPLSDAAYDTLSEMKDGQPVQVKQLAQMMRKRRRLGGDPHLLWPVLKAALLTDEHQYRARGLRPRIVHRGRDLFAAVAPALPDPLAAAERRLEAAHLEVLGETATALTARLSALDLPALERLAQIYLEREGWRDVRWIKRSGRSGYALAEPIDIPGPVLVGVRAGDVPVDRRGVGELRAGLDAKDLPRGFLMAPQELSDDARAELDRRGRPVHALVGARMVRSMAASGIGVVSTSIPVQYLDVEFFDELAEG